MQLELNKTYIDAVTLKKTHRTIENYREILERHGLSYKHIGYHLQVGETTKVQGWILHISVVRSQVPDVFDTIIPTLVGGNFPFKIVEDKETAKSLLNGNLGHSLVGKVITVYPETDTGALYLAKKLIALTKDFKGPGILTDIHLGGLVYTRYGSFNPIIASDKTGKPNNYIYNHKGDLIRDDYNIPFIMPTGIEWPFASLASPVVPPQKKISNQIYKHISLLKSDAKGNVIKAIYLRKLFLVNWCVIKQGKKNMWSDENGRDIPDRLLWQQELHNELSETIPIPKILDLFMENDDTYLVMEYIKGDSLLNRIYAINKNCSNWEQLSVTDQLQIIDYLLQITTIIGQLHQKGFVHRDITPANFLVDKKDRLVLIDNELSYSINAQKPNPPFEFGTYGFMSPEQMEVKTPTFKEDIYGLGASMIALLIGISPLVFDTSDREKLSENLFFFLHDGFLTETITSCVNFNPEMRPAIFKIQNNIQQYQIRLQLKQNEEKRSLRKEKVDALQLRSVIDGAIHGLVSEPTLIVKDLWQSRAPARDNIPGIQKSEFGKSAGLYEGITGVLYFLGRAKKSEFEVASCEKAYNKGWEYITNTHLKELPNMAPGLYGGAAGIALAFAEGIDSGMMNDSLENRLYIQQCLEMPHTGLDFANGVVGQAIAALRCNAYIDENWLQQLLTEYVSVLLNAQQKKGYWVQLQNNKGNRKIAASFSYGNAGITWFLLEYAAKYRNMDAQKAAIKSLDLLIEFVSPLKNAIKKYGFRKITEDLTTRDNISSLVLLFMKAYETLKDRSYEKIAEEILFLYPTNLVTDNFTQDIGLSGIGELYLEALRVFKNTEWQQRADWIAAVFMHTALRGEHGVYYWLGNNCDFPIADFMVGNSGIIHFLIRYLKPDKLGYRLL